MTSTSSPYTPVEEIPEIVSKLRKTFNSGVTVPLDWRRHQLEKLLSFLTNEKSAIVQALVHDLRSSPFLAEVAELDACVKETKLALEKLGEWTQPEHRSIPLAQQPGKGYILKEPLGVVLIIAPWNYPFRLCLLPLIGALAAGNCVVLKPSEITANCSSVLSHLLTKYVDPAAVHVVTGGVKETTVLLQQKFDHIFYTGNGHVGKLVMKAAAEHLTPVTLELGGKSPCLVDRTADLEVAAKRIVWGKFLNMGQTCVAPDYVLVDKQVEEALLRHLKNAVEEFYGPSQLMQQDASSSLPSSSSSSSSSPSPSADPSSAILSTPVPPTGIPSSPSAAVSSAPSFSSPSSPSSSPSSSSSAVHSHQLCSDLSRIVSAGHTQRIANLIQHYDKKDFVVGGHASVDVKDRFIAPTILTNVKPSDPPMQSEIFGPVLPVLPVSSLEEALAFVNQRDKPLALYIFSSEPNNVHKALTTTSSGGVCVNDTVMHLSCPELPFGGVGASGMGKYNGQWTFNTFTHFKPVLEKATYIDPAVRYPPYSENKAKWFNRVNNLRLPQGLPSLKQTAAIAMGLGLFSMRARL